MHRTNIYLDDGQRDALDRLAAQEGTSRSDVIRELIDRALSGGGEDIDADIAAIEQSFGELGDVEHPARGHDQRAEHLDRMWRLGA